MPSKSQLSLLADPQAPTPAPVCTVPGCSCGGPGGDGERVWRAVYETQTIRPPRAAPTTRLTKAAAPSAEEGGLGSREGARALAVFTQFQGRPTHPALPGATLFQRISATLSCPTMGPALATTLAGLDADDTHTVLAELSGLGAGVRVVEDFGYPSIDQTPETRRRRLAVQNFGDCPFAGGKCLKIQQGGVCSVTHPTHQRVYSVCANRLYEPETPGRDVKNPRNSLVAGAALGAVFPPEVVEGQWFSHRETALTNDEGEEIGSVDMTFFARDPETGKVTARALALELQSLYQTQTDKWFGEEVREDRESALKKTAKSRAGVDITSSVHKRILPQLVRKGSYLDGKPDGDQVSLVLAVDAFGFNMLEQAIAEAGPDGIERDEGEAWKVMNLRIAPVTIVPRWETTASGDLAFRYTLATGAFREVNRRRFISRAWDVGPVRGTSILEDATALEAQVVEINRKLAVARTKRMIKKQEQLLLTIQDHIGPEVEAEVRFDDDLADLAFDPEADEEPDVTPPTRGRPQR